MSLLLPDGITGLGDCPFPLFDAITNGLRILGYEEWPIADRPPRRIWLDSDKRSAWWAKIEARNADGTEEEDDDDPANYEQNAFELITRG